MRLSQPKTACFYMKNILKYFVLFSILLLNSCYLQKEGNFDKDFIMLLYKGLSISFSIGVISALVYIWIGRKEASETTFLFLMIALFIFIVA